MSTYRIQDRGGGTLGRWLPSIEAAKERLLTAIREGVENFGDPMPVVTFAVSTTDEDGDPCDEHVQCFEDGQLEAAIFTERLCWPTSPHSPPIEMVAQPSTVVTEPCHHARLVCTDAKSPRITCAACGTVWLPDGAA